jgi:O-antigen/teichoic acid export membrane protein
VGPPGKTSLHRVGSRLSGLLGDSLFRNSLFIMSSTAVTSLLGFGFWVITARSLPASEVGRAAALVSAMLFTSVFTNFGIGQVFVSRLSARDPGHDWSLTVNVGLALTALASLLGGLVAAILLPTLIPALKGGVGAGAFLLLPFGVAGAACSLVIDFACIAERHAKHALLRNTAGALLRLILVAITGLVPVNGTVWILSVWVGSFLLIDAWGMLRVLPSLGHDYRATLRGWRQELREMRGLIAGHQTINLGAQASFYLLPVLVSARLGPEQNAYFYTTFMVATALFFIAPAISNALFAEGSHHPDRLSADLGRAVRYIVMLMGPPALVLVFAGDRVLGLFGPAYAEQAGTLLILLVVSAAFDAALQLTVAILRAKHRLRDAAVATWAMLLTAVPLTWILLPSMGLEGAGVGWLAGKVVGMAVAMLYLPGARGPQAGAPDLPRSVEEGVAEELEEAGQLSDR